MQKPTDFAQRLLAWFDVHGRHDLPWQVSGDPYPVWVSEIMLQQTQVATVIPYFERFMQRFPDIRALASAEIDQVLHLWSGLGYYARARNLHKAAGIIMERHAGRFPTTVGDVEDLPGIGRSTAGAILTLGLGQRHAILDGNVKRVLTRHAMIDGWPGQAGVQKSLWALSERLTPDVRVADYTQAIMDLGATVCTRTRPDCLACPVSHDCAARVNDAIEHFPTPKPRKPTPLRETRMLLIRDGQGRICLVRRPSAGIWGGLWSLPECSHEPTSWAMEKLGMSIQTGESLPPIRHAFTHFRLDIHVIPATLAGPQDDRVMEMGGILWYNPADTLELGIAAPVAKIISGNQSSSRGKP